ncbi:MAG: pyrroline-5-carboxylate reductase [Bauldia sp.]
MSLGRLFSDKSPLVLVGSGKMGGALAVGWFAQGLDARSLIVIDPSPPPSSLRILETHGVAAVAAPPEGTAAKALVLAVKPQILRETLPALRSLVEPETLVLSIAAGIRIATLQAGLGRGRMVRSMPNTPAEIGMGITVAVKAADVGAGASGIATALLEAVGSVGWVDDEALMDAVTAVSGSGPAYVFYLVECLAAAGRSAGLPADLAVQLARETVAGAGALLSNSDLPAETLRQNVTSPNGTTAAALAVLMAGDGLAPLMVKAVAAAKRRSEELSA